VLINEKRLSFNYFPFEGEVVFAIDLITGPNLPYYEFSIWDKMQGDIWGSTVFPEFLSSGARLREAVDPMLSNIQEEVFGGDEARFFHFRTEAIDEFDTMLQSVKQQIMLSEVVGTVAGKDFEASLNMIINGYHVKYVLVYVLGADSAETLLLEGISSSRSEIDEIAEFIADANEITPTMDNFNFRELFNLITELYDKRRII
jgi:hypothetical protein